MKLFQYIIGGIIISVFSYIIFGLMLHILPSSVAIFFDIVSIITCFAAFVLGLLIVPKYFFKNKKDKKRILKGCASIYGLSTLTFMYITYLLGYEQLYPKLYVLGFNISTTIIVLLLIMFGLPGKKANGKTS